jgi:hypothetical protein
MINKADIIFIILGVSVFILFLFLFIESNQRNIERQNQMISTVEYTFNETRCSSTNNAVECVGNNKFNQYVCYDRIADEYFEKFTCFKKNVCG